jgi:hypothetical protein
VKALACWRGVAQRRKNSWQQRTGGEKPRSLNRLAKRWRGALGRCITRLVNLASAAPYRHQNGWKMA